MENIYEMIKIINAENKSISDKIKALSYEEKMTELDSLQEQIKENGMCLANYAVNDAVKKFIGPETPENKDLYEQLYFFPINMQAYFESNIAVEFNKEEIAFIEELNSILEAKKEQYRQEQEKNREIIDKLKELRKTYTNISEKLSKGENNSEHFTFAENNILAKLALNKKGFQFAIEILNYIKDLTSIIEKNRIAAIDDTQKIGEVSNEYLLKEDEIIGLLAEFNIDSSKVSDKYMDMLRKYGSLKNMRELLEFLSTHEEYDFLTTKKDKNETNIEEICRIEKLMLTLRFSTTKILEYLIENAKRYDVKVEEIYKVDGVFKHISKSSKKSQAHGGDSDSIVCNGSFEYYQENVKTFNMMSAKLRKEQGRDDINLVKSIIKRSPSILKTPSELIKKNIMLLEKYNLDVIKYDKMIGDYTLKCPTVLEARHLEEFIDLCVENKGMYRYIRSYPSILKSVGFFAKTIQDRLDGTISFNYNGTLVGTSTFKSQKRETGEEISDVYEYFDRSRIESYAKAIPDELQKTLVDASYNSETFMEIYQTEPLLKDLEETVDEDINKGLSYNINGVAVSKNKFDKIWPKLRKKQLTSTDEETKNCSPNDLLLYALTYNSIYSDQELNELEEFTKKYRFGGANNGNPERHRN